MRTYGVGLVVFAALWAASACSEGDPLSPDSGVSSMDDGGGPGDDGGSPRDAGRDAEPDPEVDGGPIDSGMTALPPVPEGAPGGPVSAAPIVGCADAERPAQRDEGSTAVCEAVGRGRCWYISPEGDDAAAGTFDAPFGTAQTAVRQAGPGDVIYLRGGVYDQRNSHISRAHQWDNEAAGVTRGFVSAGRVSLPTWAGGENYNVASGTDEAPIIVRSLPGERACLSGAGGIRFGSIQSETAYWRVENVTVHRAAINVGGGTGNAADPRNQTHDIVIRNNEVYEFTTRGGGNPGLVRVNRGDGGGPYRITVESNILHDMIPIDPDGTTRTWDTTSDVQHFGAVTTLSCETYLGPECGGNGEITIENNHIYRVPQAFFFKNPSAGPFNIRGNVIHDTVSLGQWSPSNILFELNLVYGRGGSIQLGGSGGAIEGGVVYERMGHNITIQNNTFIGFNTLIHFRIYAAGHTMRGNVIQGLRRAMADRNWNNMGLVFQGASWVQADTTADLAASQLAMGNDFDDNCFVTATPDFIAYGRRYNPGSGAQLTHLSLDDARTRLSFDVSSDVVGSAGEAFVDFDGGDYRIAEGSACAGRGAPVPEWANP